ncbi:MAG: phosphoadenylyl-sulfate reductase [Salaquimonas sp.]
MLPEPQTLAFHASLQWLEASSLEMLRMSLKGNLCGKTAVVSSFGAESAILLHLVSRIAPDAPVLFVDTKMMFQETLDYQIELAGKFGLSNVSIVSADQVELRRNDVFGRLHKNDPDACCNLRKTKPLERALASFDAWISGRKRHQSQSRVTMKPMEVDESGKVKLNPMLHWDHDDIKAYFDLYHLPCHPLTSKGFTSIGCAPCTAKPLEGQDARSGRWQGQEKTECGIHVVNGKIIRQSA